MGLFFAIFVVIIIVLFKFLKLQARDRLGRQYSDYASHNGLRYCEGLFWPKGFYEKLRKMKSLGHGPSREYNVIGNEGDIEYSWGIYHYLTTEKVTTRRSRRNRGFSMSSYGTRTRDVDNYINYFLIACPHMNLPYFFARDEKMILDSIGSVLGGQDIDFKEDKQFSSSFVLQGDVEERIRRVFTPEVRKLFTTLYGNGYTFEGCGDALLILGGSGDLNERIELSRAALKIANAFINNSAKQKENNNNLENKNVSSVVHPKQPVRKVIQTGFKSDSKNQVSASNGYNQQNSNYNQQSNGYDQQNNYYNSQPDTCFNTNPDISELKGKPGLKEILKNRENKR